MQIRMLSLLVVVLLTSSLTAQDLSTPFISGSWQSTISNPALLHQLDAKITIGLPGLNGSFSSENFTYNDITTEVKGSTNFDPDKAIEALKDRNQINSSTSLETIGLGWKGNKLALGISHQSHFNVAMDIPKTLAQVIWQGNAQFIGETVDIAPYLHINNINEFSLSAAYKITEKVTFGARAKYLIGIADLSVNKGSLELTTSDEAYQLQLDPDYTINSSGAIEYNGLNDVSSSISVDRLSFDKLGQNSGLGFDLGLHLDLGNIRIQAAALDLGSKIEWKEDVTNLSLTESRAFEGLDILQDLLNDTSSVDGILDSLEVQFDPTETNNSYTTSIGSRYLIAGEYDLNSKLTVGALVAVQDFDLFNEVSLALSARYSIADIIKVGGTYSYRRNSSANIGANVQACLGPINLIMATSNVFSFINPKDSKFADARIGLSLAFGRGK